MADSFMDKYMFSLKWQANPHCLKTCWGGEVSSLINLFVDGIRAIFNLTTGLLILPLCAFYCVIYPFFHLGFYPIYAAFKMKDGMIEKTNKKLEEAKKEDARRAARKSDEEADPMFYQDEEEYRVPGDDS